MSDRKLRIVMRRYLPFAGRVVRTTLRATFVALFLTAAFAVVPALGTAADASSADAARQTGEGVLIAGGILVLTLGAAVLRWNGEEPGASI